MLSHLPALTDFARSLALAARAETLPRFRMGGTIENKLAEGFDPVTLADQRAEKTIRTLIEQTFPDHGILGEEYPERKAKGPWRWVLDPVDGTRAFVCGIPSWTTLIALEYESRPVLGLIDQPYTDELWIGGAEETLFVHREKATHVKTSGVSELSDVRLSTTDPRPYPSGYFTDEEAEFFNRIAQHCKLCRFSQDAYGYGLVASGQLDLVIEAGLQPHDAAALIPVVEGAGGIVRDWRGQKLDKNWHLGFEQNGQRGQLIAATSETLLQKTLALLAE